MPHLRARRLLPRAIISSTPPPPIVSFLILIIRRTLDLVCNSTWPPRLQGAAPLPSPVKVPAMPFVCVSHVAVYMCSDTHVPYVQMSHVARSAETRIHIHDQTSFHGHCQCSSRRLIRITRCCICRTCTYFNLAIPAVIPASQCLFVVVQLIQNC